MSQIRDMPIFGAYFSAQAFSAVLLLYYGNVSKRTVRANVQVAFFAHAQNLRRFAVPKSFKRKKAALLHAALKLTCELLYSTFAKCTGNKKFSLYSKTIPNCLQNALQ